MSVDIKACTRQEPTAELVRELTTSCGVPGVRVREDTGDAWPGTVENEDGNTLCFVEAPEVLADPEDVDDLAEGAQLDDADLPLWLVTVKPPFGAGDQSAVAMTALATGLVANCGGWAFAAGEVVASGPHSAELTDADEPLSYVAVTPAEPSADLLAKVRERRVAASGPFRVDTVEDLSRHVGAEEAAGRTPPVWVTTLTADSSCRASVTLALAVAAAEFVLTAGADVFDSEGKRLPLPHSDLAD